VAIASTDGAGYQQPPIKLIIGKTAVYRRIRPQNLP